MLATLELEGLICFHCPLLEGSSTGEFDAGECSPSANDLLPVVSDAKSGIKLAILEKQIVGYAVFGRPEVFPKLEEMDFEPEEGTLVVAALYVTDQALEQNVDADLLIAVMDFAREKEFKHVQVLCREENDPQPLARAELLSAAGFELTQVEDGPCFAQTTVEAWDRPDNDSPGQSLTVRP